ncbi:hypothetical protein ABPG72_018141 [Tetrahymena utriculariae]
MSFNNVLKIDFEPDVILDEQELSKILALLKAGELLKLRLNLKGNNFFGKSECILQRLLNGIKQQQQIRSLMINFGYENHIKFDEFQILLKSISKQQNLENLSLLFDFKVIEINKNQKEDINKLIEFSKNIPQINQLELSINVQKETNFGSTLNLIKLFVFNQKQIKNLKLEIIQAYLDYDEMKLLAKELFGEEELKCLNISFKESLSISVEYCQIAKSQSGRKNIETQKNELKNLSISIKEVYNSKNVIESIFENLNQQHFINLEKLLIHLEEINDMEGIEIEKYSSTKLSNLKIFNFKIVNEIASNSMLGYIYDLLIDKFDKNQNLALQQQSQKIQLQSSGNDQQEFTFTYDSKINKLFLGQNYYRNLNLLDRFQRLKLIKLLIQNKNGYPFQTNQNNYLKQANFENNIGQLLQLERLNIDRLDLELDLNNHQFKLTSKIQEEVKLEIELSIIIYLQKIFEFILQVYRNAEINAKIFYQSSYLHFCPQKLDSKSMEFNRNQSQLNFNLNQISNVNKLFQQQFNNSCFIEFLREKQFKKIVLKGFDFSIIKNIGEISVETLSIQNCTNYEIDNLLHKFKNIKQLQIKNPQNDNDKIKSFLIQVLKNTELIFFKLECANQHQENLKS